VSFLGNRCRRAAWQGFPTDFQRLFFKAVGIILTPFNYQKGLIYGSELTASYTGTQLKAYGNVA